MKIKISILTATLLCSPIALAEVDYGPLKTLIGQWKSTTAGGVDVAPGQKTSAVGAGGPAVEPYYEVMTFEEAATATNASEQDLAAIYYSQEVFRKRDGVKFHDQRGYLIYDKKNNLVYNSYCIPRNTCVVAEGPASTKMTLTAKASGIAESAFMSEKASTKGFTIQLDISKPDQITYQQHTQLQIYGKPFAHTDGSTLMRVK